MKKTVLAIMSVILFTAPALCDTKAPTGIAGFVLGGNIADVSGLIRGDTALTIRHMEYLEEVEMKKTEGFKSGLIGYGTCEAPGRILRIKLKYLDSSKKFFSNLLKRFEGRFGKPVEWRGDPFHVVLAWKWSFTDRQNNRISLILQHNIKDVEQKMGNSVKLTMTDRVEAERLCFEKKHPQHRSDTHETPAGKRWAEEDWERFVPR
jgi:hypothetical protein